MTTDADIAVLIPQDLSLSTLVAELSQLLDLREEIEPVEAEALKVIDEQIQRYVAAEVRKVDGIAWYRRMLVSQIAAVKEEIGRLRVRLESWERRKESLDAATIYALQLEPKKRTESSLNRLRTQKNPRSVDAYDVAVIPDEFIRVAVVMPLPAWRVLRASHESLLEQCSTAQSEVSRSAIADALKRGEQVPGARWAPETEHLWVD